MKLNNQLRVTIISIILFFNFPGLSQQLNTNNQGEETQQKTYYFGLRKTSAPISYFDEKAGNWKGYCYALIETLRASNFRIEIVELGMNNRFKGIGIKEEPLDAQCAPDTITPEREKIISKNGLDGKFSDTFALTGAGALLLKDSMQKLNSENELKKLKFGIIKGTTTSGIVNNYYPSFDKKQYVYLSDNLDAMTKLRRGDIDVYFNDEMILLNILKILNQEAGKEKYSIKPGLMSREEYGTIVYHTGEAKNQQLLQAINSSIQKADTQFFGNTQLKILKNNYFEQFLKENGLTALPIPSPQLTLDSDHEKSKPINEWGNILPVLVILIITPLGILCIFLFFRQYKNKRKTNKPPQSSIAESVHKEPSKYEPPSIPFNVNVYNHNHSRNAIDNMPNNNFDQRNANINAGVQGTNEGTSNQQVIQNIYTPEQKQDLQEFAKDIQRILAKMEINNPNTTLTLKEKQNIVSYEIPREQRNRIVRALKAGGEEALKEFLDNPYLNVAIAIVKEWQNEE
jgi:ABC-type amino acid transport substrate-binding protein